MLSYLVLSKTRLPRIEPGTESLTPVAASGTDYILRDNPLLSHWSPLLMGFSDDSHHQRTSHFPSADKWSPK